MAEELVKLLKEKEAELLDFIYEDECLICEMAARHGHTAPIYIQQHVHVALELEHVQDLITFYKKMGVE